jgi:hypothetical protein
LCVHTPAIGLALSLSLFWHELYIYGNELPLLCQRLLRWDFRFRASNDAFCNFHNVSSLLMMIFTSFFFTLARTFLGVTTNNFYGSRTNVLKKESRRKKLDGFLLPYTPTFLRVLFTIGSLLRRITLLSGSLTFFSLWLLVLFSLYVE